MQSIIESLKNSCTAFIRTRFFLQMVEKINHIHKKLIIQYFDEVIADTELIWLKAHQKILKEKFGNNWTIYEAKDIFAQIS